jgi:hypothetical protein
MFDARSDSGAVRASLASYVWFSNARPIDVAANSAARPAATTPSAMAKTSRFIGA